jgi:hypothetical protein
MEDGCPIFLFDLGILVEAAELDRIRAYSFQE